MAAGGGPAQVAGTSAAFLGESAVGWDRFARQSRLDDTARRCFRGLDASTAAWIGAYVDGVNAGLGDGARRSPEHEEWPGLSGDHDCVLSTTSVPGLTDLSSRGPAARYVWDLAHRDDSLWAVPFGASGVPGDPHRRDQLPLWLRGELAPVITDWTRLTEETRPTSSPSCEAVHEQTVEGFGTVRIVPLDPVADAGLVHSWVTEERAQYWGMLGHSREQVREIYEDRLAMLRAVATSEDLRERYFSSVAGVCPVEELYTPELLELLYG